MEKYQEREQDLSVVIDYAIFLLEKQIELKEIKECIKRESKIFKEKGVKTAKAKQILNSFIKECKKSEQEKEVEEDFKTMLRESPKIQALVGVLIDEEES